MQNCSFVYNEILYQELLEIHIECCWQYQIFNILKSGLVQCVYYAITIKGQNLRSSGADVPKLFDPNGNWKGQCWQQSLKGHSPLLDQPSMISTKSNLLREEEEEEGEAVYGAHKNESIIRKGHIFKAAYCSACASKSHCEISEHETHKLISCAVCYLGRREGT